MLWRLHAQRLLVERGKTDVVPALVKAVGDGSMDEIGLNGGVVHALWTLEGLNSVDRTILANVAADAHPTLREHALRVVAETHVTLAIARG